MTELNEKGAVYLAGSNQAYDYGSVGAQGEGAVPDFPLTVSVIVPSVTGMAETYGLSR